MPDSKSVVFAAENAVWRVPITGGASMKTDVPFNQFGFSPDGKLMFLTLQKIESGAMHAKLLVTPASDSKTILHTFDTPYGMQSPQFTPDGKAIAFLLTRNHATNIWEQRLSERAPSQLTTFGSGEMFAFNWSGDGKQLAYSRGQRKTNVILMRSFR